MATDMCGRIRGFLSAITVEPVMFLFSLVSGLYLIASQSLYVAKMCSVNLNHSREVCDDIFDHKEVQIEVQKEVAELQAYSRILQAFPMVAFALFAGPWSDRAGRKVVIALSCFGYVINNGVFMINTGWWHQLKAEYLLFECLQDCTGGYVCFFMGCSSYMSDITTKEHRTKRLAIVAGLFPIGFYLGLSVSGIMKKQLGFMSVFGLGMASALLAMLYTIFVLKDSRTMRPTEAVEDSKEPEGTTAEDHEVAKHRPTEDHVASSMFDVSNVKRAFRVTFKARPHGLRTYVLLMGSVFLMENFIVDGKDAVVFLFLRKEFSWDEVEFGRYVSLFGLVGLFAQYVAVPFLTEDLGWRDTALLLVAVVGCSIQELMTALAEADWVLYLAGAAGFLNVCVTTACRSCVTKLVGPFEVGAVFSVMAALQAVMPLVAAPTYGFLYKSTIETFTGAFLVLSAGLYLVAGAVLLYTHFGLKRAENEEKEAREKEQEEEGEMIK